jgi:hypothetical protein
MNAIIGKVERKLGQKNGAKTREVNLEKWSEISDQWRKKLKYWSGNSRKKWSEK